MRILRQFALSLVCVGLVSLAVPARTQADEVSQEMLFTFSGPVALPGVVLPAGTYRFVLVNPTSEQNVVRVLSHDGTVSYGTFLTVATTLSRSVESLPLTFEHGQTATPETIKAWFYPGPENGHTFIYPAQPASH